MELKPGRRTRPDRPARVQKRKDVKVQREAKERKAEERRCIVTGESGSKDGLIRFVVDPEGRIVADLAERLPGRGLWVSARREIVEKALTKGAFAKAARMKVDVAETLADEVEGLLVRRASDALGLARKAGSLVAGFEKVLKAIAAGNVALLIEARDGSEDGGRKLENALVARYGDRARVLRGLWGDEMGLALGRANVVHAALTQGSMNEKVLVDFTRLELYGRKSVRND